MTKMKSPHGMAACLYVAVIVSLVFCPAVMAEKEKPAYELQTVTDKPDAIYGVGEKVLFKTRLLHEGKPLAGESVNWTVRGDGGYEKKGTVTTAEEPVAFEAALERPGMLFCTLSWTSGDKKETARGVAGAAIAPEKIKAAREEPKDFDAFWKKQLADSEKLPMNVKLVPFQPEKFKEQGVEVYDIKIDCLGGAPVSGYLVKPIGAKTKSLPIVVSYHGAGVRGAGVPVGDAKHGALALDINAHGIENGHPPKFYEDLLTGTLKNYRFDGEDDREKCYFKGMYLRAARALQFMKTLPEWDGVNIGVKGGSQGGGQALVAAGLDPQVTVCLAYVPALCYHTGYVDNEFGGWPGFLRPAPNKTIREEVVATVPYFDAAIFAKRIKASCFLSTGFVDYVCSPTSVYVAYNNIKTTKTIVTTPNADHNIPGSTSAEGNRWFWEQIDKNRIP